MSKVNKVGEVRMLRKLVPALLMVIGLFSGSTANASPLTFYTNEAGWLAAVSGFTVGAYPHDVTYTDTLVNVALFPPTGTCCFVSTPPPIGPFAPVLGADFSSVDITFSAVGLDTCFLPEICTFATDVTVNFPTPIYGFASSSAFIRQDRGAGPITFNGQAAIPPLPIEDYGGFFGVVGLINSLDLFCTDCDPTHDENGSIELPGIVVATVDEPSGFASLATGLVLLAGALSEFRRRGHRWQR